MLKRTNLLLGQLAIAELTHQLVALALDLLRCRLESAGQVRG